MDTIYKSFAKGVGLIGISNVLIGVSGIIILPILTKSLSSGDYGAYVQVSVTTALLAFPLTLGLPIALVRFVTLFNEKKNVREVFYSILFLIVLVNTCVSAVLLLLATPLATYLFNGNFVVAELLPLLVFFTSVNVYLLDYFRAFQQISKYAFFNFAQIYIGVALISFFVFAGYGVVGAVIGLLMAQLFLFSVMLFIIIWRIGFRLPRMAHLRTYLSFSIPLIPTNLSFWAVNSSDRYLIGLFLGASYVAYYAPSYTLGLFISMLGTPFTLMLATSLPKHYDEVNTTVVKTAFKYAFKYFLTVAIPSVFIVSVLSKPILLALSTPEIALNGYYVTPFIALAGLLWGAQLIFSQVIVLEKKTQILGTLWAASAVINVGLNISLIPYLGIIAAAVTTLISFSFVFIVTATYSRTYLKFDVNPRFIFKSIIASLAVIAIILGLDLVGKFSALATAIASVVMYMTFLFLMKGFKKHEFVFFVRLLRQAPDS